MHMEYNGRFSRYVRVRHHVPMDCISKSRTHVDEYNMRIRGASGSVRRRPSLIDALGRLWRKKPEAFRGGLRRAAGQQNVTRGVDCNERVGWYLLSTATKYPD
ncbi:hypothetical protein EVAR_100810_1 [Eumeta japonica]|uniref:Uncharacterized protein n=1 Tax=Eumeta variegata TaxID=151549 RepID=A0A4C2A8P7_EUMVA|nr:hypothetical protein EVAR_100810_1 [Eumeta japonica]